MPATALLPECHARLTLNEEWLIGSAQAAGKDWRAAERVDTDNTLAKGDKGRGMRIN